MFGKFLKFFKYSESPLKILPKTFLENCNMMKLIKLDLRVAELTSFRNYHKSILFHSSSNP